MASVKTGLLDLDDCLISALKMLSRESLPKLEIPDYSRPLVVGSGNAAVTGKILFSGKDAVFADESTYKEKLESAKGIDSCILISASGKKHAPEIAQFVSSKGVEVILLTNNPNAAAKKYASKTYVFPKQPEPYTYNTATYLGMILSKTGENVSDILEYINKIKKSIPKNLKKYDAFYIIVPEKFSLIREMFYTKFDELFGPMLLGRVYTPEQTKHAKTLVLSDKELFIGIGYENAVFGKNRLNIPLPKNADYGALMAIGYYVIGQIQKQHPPYFKKNLKRYVKEASKMFGEEIKMVVE